MNMKESIFAPGDIIIRAGDKLDKIYFINKGLLENYILI